MQTLKESDVQWVVVRDDITDLNPQGRGDLGVKIGDQIFTLYKGESLARSEGLFYRPISKRDFGESLETNQAPNLYDWVVLGKEDDLNCSCLLPEDEILKGTASGDGDIYYITLGEVVARVHPVSKEYSFSISRVQISSEQEQMNLLASLNRLENFVKINDLKLGNT